MTNLTLNIKAGKFQTSPSKREFFLCDLIKSSNTIVETYTLAEAEEIRLIIVQENNNHVQDRATCF